MVASKTSHAFFLAIRVRLLGTSRLISSLLVAFVAVFESPRFEP
jgi:hypothetical protein